MTPDPATPDPRPAECAAFAAAVQAVLDRERGPEALDGDHPSACPDCRGLAEAAKRLLDGISVRPQPPVDLADRIVATAIRDRRLRRRTRFAAFGGLAAVAAALLLGVGFYTSRPPTENKPEVVQHTPAPASVPEPPPPRVADRVADAGSAVAALTRRATEQAVTPTRDLIPPPRAVSLPAGESLPGIEPAAESLAGMPQAAKSGIEPVADKTRRAINLFLRDTGVGSANRPGS